MDTGNYGRASKSGCSPALMLTFGTLVLTIIALVGCEPAKPQEGRPCQGHETRLTQDDREVFQCEDGKWRRYRQPR